MRDRGSLIILKKKTVVTLVILFAVLGAGGSIYWNYLCELERRYPKFYSGNGRLEATEVFISARHAGRIETIFVREGDFVKVGDKLVKMSTSSLEAGKAQSQANILMLEGKLKMAKATLLEQEFHFDSMKKDHERQEKLFKHQAQSEKNYELALTERRKAEAELLYARANIQACEGSLAAEKANLQGIQCDIDDSILYATYSGRIQYILAHDGEVLSEGGRVLNLVNLTDVYITFFLPTYIAGKVAIGAEVKVVFDADPENPIDARVTFVDPVAQFTPKSVETKSEREKMMFRIKAQIAPQWVKENLEHVKTGLPGVAYVKLDPHSDWKDCPIPRP